MWRSILFVPVLEERFVAKAAERGADAVVLDLEASIAEERKADARAALPDAVARLAGKVPVGVRITPLHEHAEADCDAAIIAGVATIHMARCETPDDVAAIDAKITALETARDLPQGAINIVAMLESPAAVLRAEAIALASKRMAGLTLGIEDYAEAMGAGIAPSDALIRPAAYQVIQAACAAGIAPLVVPLTLADFRNLDGLAEAARYARSIGSVGGYAVHPAQIEVLNRAFSPSEDELQWARRVLDGAQSGKGVFKIDGKMVDLPVIKRAEAIIKAAGAK